MVVSTPLQTLTIAAGAAVSQASRFARTTSPTYTKSTDDEPSPKRVSGLPSSMRFSQRTITSTNRERTSMRGP